MKNIDPNRTYTYKEIKDWEGQWELIEGVPYLLASPSYQHQYILGELFAELRLFFRNIGCHIIMAPFDVQLDEEVSEDEAINTVQPDLLVVCNKDKLTNSRVKGSPDLVIEVLSPSTGLKDRNKKYNLYQSFGVKEYWMVDPMYRTVEVLSLSEGFYQKRAVFGDKDTLVSFQFKDLQMDLSKILHTD